MCVLYIFYIKDVPNPSTCMSDVLFKNPKLYKKENISKRRALSYSKVVGLVRLTDLYQVPAIALSPSRLHSF